MNQSALITAMRARLTSDTGTGGLFATGTPLIGNVFFARATTVVPAAGAAGNYIVLVVANTSAEDDMTFNGIIYQINVNIYMTQIEGNTIVLSSIIDRVYERLQDFTPTLSAWTPSGPFHFVNGGATDLPDEESLQHQLTFELRESKVRS